MNINVNHHGSLPADINTRHHSFKVKMEFPETGKQCSHLECKQLDFLAVSCTHCSKSFCKIHLSPFVHTCQGFKDNVLSDSDLAEKERERWQVKCFLTGCNKKDLIPMYCLKCNQHFCLAHRHEDQHR